ncbi:hypothetical protein [Arthrobacter oryzae]|uniref:hypothetical protein n=1 Tax=Arthrobacter oryzae TaxID=409290 RepID=UPI0016064072|nr:hypothetical protein [Arthrobacter oryzae]
MSLFKKWKIVHVDVKKLVGGQFEGRWRIGGQTTAYGPDTIGKIKREAYRALRR